MLGKWFECRCRCCDSRPRARSIGLLLRCLHQTPQRPLAPWRAQSIGAPEHRRAAIKFGPSKAGHSPRRTPTSSPMPDGRIRRHTCMLFAAGRVIARPRASKRATPRSTACSASCGSRTRSTNTHRSRRSRATRWSCSSTHKAVRVGEGGWFGAQMGRSGHQVWRAATLASGGARSGGRRSAPRHRRSSRRSPPAGLVHTECCGRHRRRRIHGCVAAGACKATRCNGCWLCAARP